MQLTISFTEEGTDPIQAMNEAEAILHQQIESNVVDSIMKYVRTKKQRSDALPLKWFDSKDYKILVDSQAMDIIGIGLDKN